MVFLVSSLAAALIGTVYASNEVDWCSSHAADDIYSSEFLGGNFLPSGGINMVDYTFDNFGYWYIAGEEKSTGSHKVWRIPYTLDKTEEIFVADASSIDVYSSYGSTYVFAIVSNEVRMYGTPGNRRSPLEGDFVIIQKADDNHEWRGLVFDTSAKFLYVTDRKMNQVYRFDPTSPGYPRKMVAGNPDGRPADDATHLDHPEGVKFANGELYILQGSSEGGHIVRWTPGKSERKFVYDFLVNGRLGFEVADVTQRYIYYRSSTDSVYKHCGNSPCNEPVLIAGGCGRGHNGNQLINARSGALRMAYSGKLQIWDFGGERFVHWANRPLRCPTTPCVPSSSTSSTMPIITTTTRSTVTSSTTTATTPSTSATTTTTTTTTPPTTTTTTTAPSTTTTSTTTPFTTTTTATTPYSSSTTSRSTTVRPNSATTESGWCSSHAADNIYSSEFLGRNFLPSGGINMVDYTFDNFGYWYIAGEEKSTGSHKVWRIPYTLDKTEEIFVADASSIDVYSSYGSTYVFAIVSNEVRMYGTPGNRRSPLEGDFVIIQKADDNHEWRGLVFDTSAKFLYVTDRKMNQVYRFDPTSPGYPRKMVAGNPDGRPADDATHLDHPEGVKFANGELYILQGSSEGGHIVRWTPGKSERKFVYDFLVNGRLGFEVADVTQRYIYYRSSTDSVYKHCDNSPCNEPVLIAGGCGRGHNGNQLINARSGALRMAYSGKLQIWDFGGERFVHWANRPLRCPTTPCVPSSSTSSTMPIITTTTRSTVTSSTTTATTPSTSATTTTTTTTTPPTTTTTTTAPSTTTTSTTTPFTTTTTATTPYSSSTTSRSTTVRPNSATTESGWCSSHAADNIYSSEFLGRNFLPSGGINMVDYTFDNFGYWYIAGEEKSTGSHKVWRIPYTFDKTEEIFVADALSIDVYYSYGSTYVFAIVDNEVRMYGTPGNRRSPLEGDFVIIQKANDNHEWRGLVFDTSAKFLYVTDRKMNQVYRFDPTSPGYPRKMVAGNPDGRPADDATHLDHPEGVKFANGDLYILQGSSEGGHIVRWTPGKSERKFVYDFLVNGRLGFEVADVTQRYIYYRSSTDSVYKHCDNSPCNEPVLIAGGCGRGHNGNQLINARSGALRMAYSGKLLVWDFGGERFVHWANRPLRCPATPCVPSSSTSTAMPITATTTWSTTTTTSTPFTTTSTSTPPSTTTASSTPPTSTTPSTPSTTTTTSTPSTTTTTSTPSTTTTTSTPSTTTTTSTPSTTTTTSTPSTTTTTSTPSTTTTTSTPSTSTTTSTPSTTTTTSTPSTTTTTSTPSTTTTTSTPSTSTTTSTPSTSTTTSTPSTTTTTSRPSTTTTTSTPSTTTTTSRPSTTTTTSRPSTTTTTSRPSTTTTTSRPSTTTTTSRPSTTTTTSRPSTTTTTSRPSTTTTTSRPSTTTTTSRPSTTTTTSTPSTTTTTSRPSTTTTTSRPSTTTTTSRPSTTTTTSRPSTTTTTSRPSTTTTTSRPSTNTTTSAPSITTTTSTPSITTTTSTPSSTTTTSTPSTTTTTSTPSTTTTTSTPSSTTTTSRPSSTTTTSRPSTTTTTSRPSTTTTTSTPSTSTTTSAHTTKTTSATTNTNRVPSTTSTTSPGDCRAANAMCDSFYKGSYCKTWLYPQVCSGTDIPCSCEAPVTSTTPAVRTSTPSSTTTGASTTTEVSTTSIENATCDAYCDQMSSGSFCKYWQVPSVCSGTDILCSCGQTTAHPPPSTASPTMSFTTSEPSVLKCDAFCDSAYEGSYCKYWSTPSVCSSTNLPCQCD